MLQRSARRLGRPLWLIECGPDDTPEQAKHFKDLQRNCPDLKFLRLGGDGHVPEEVKHQALWQAILCSLWLTTSRKLLDFLLQKQWRQVDQ